MRGRGASAYIYHLPAFADYLAITGISIEYEYLWFSMWSRSSRLSRSSRSTLWTQDPTDAMKKEDLEILLSLSRVQVKIRHGPVGIRPSDVPLLIGDPTKFRDLAGWASRIPQHTA